MEPEERIRTRTARVAIVGLGYVGLPLAVGYSEAGFHVLGIDVDARRVQSVNEGASYIADVEDRRLQEAVKSGRLRAASTYEGIASADAIVVCVPTPLDAHKNPDTSYIESVMDGCASSLRAGQLIVLESTTYPGTTEDIVLPRVRGRGLEIGRDILLAFSPERIDPGNARFHVANIPKIVGGVTPRCTEAASLLYRTAFGIAIHHVSSPRVAEMAKLLENVYRIVNVSLVNELATLCDRMGIDVWEVIEAAKTKPFGFHAFYPGPGMGGHCIPVDAFYLSWKAKEHEFSTRFIELAGQVNDSMPEYVVHRVGELLNARGKAVKGSRVLVLGVAYKRDVADVRESPALKIAEKLRTLGAVLSYHDPHVPALRLEGGDLASVPLSTEALRAADLVLVLTDHGAVDYALVASNAALVYDTRNALRDHLGPNVVRLGAPLPGSRAP